MLDKQPAEAAKLIASYFIAEPTLKTLKRGELPREVVIEEAIGTQTFSAKLDANDLARIQELADILQEQGSLKTRDGKSFDTSAILDLTWQEAREL
jgi:hypothetical protein